MRTAGASLASSNFETRARSRRTSGATPTDRSTRLRALLLVVAPAPPPLTGQTLATRKLLKVFAERGLRVVLADTAPVRDRSLRALLGRLVRLGAALLVIPVSSVRGAKVAYLSVLSNRGMYHTALCALLARIFGYRVFLHHHSAAHAKSPVARMRALAMCAGRKAVHITLCEPMRRQLIETYSKVESTLVLSNPFVVEQSLEEHPSAPHRPLCLGHLGNLTMEKGLGAAIELFQRLHDELPDIRLAVAGPVGSPVEAAVIAETRRSFENEFEHIGFADDKRKAIFFRSIDVFLFPSLYSNEAAPLVCLEAMSHGIPFLSYDWGYIRSATANAGVYFTPSRNFADQALPVLRRWVSDPDELLERSRAVRVAFGALLARSHDELDQLMTLMQCGRSTPHAAS